MADVLKVITIPENVTFVTYDPEEHNTNLPNAIYLKENNMYEAAADYWQAIPSEFQKAVSQDKYKSAIINTQFIPRYQPSWINGSHSRYVQSARTTRR